MITFVNPPIRPYRKIMRNFDCATESKGNYLYQPYDFLLMSARIPSGWDFDLIDAVADKLDDEQVLSQLQAKPPAILVLSMADTNWSQDLGFLQKLRRELRDAVILTCGDSFREKRARGEVAAFCQGIISEPLSVDFGESLKSRSLRYIDGTDHGWDHAQIDLKRPRQIHLGVPRHSSFLNKRYRWPFAKHFSYTTVFTAWGCPYSCSYCIMSRFPNIWRPAEDVLAEMTYIKSKGFREIYIGDRSFGVPRSNSIQILRGMIERRFGFSWSTYFHPNQYDPELLEVMSASGCHTLIIGIESANTENLKKFGRKIHEGRLTDLLAHARRLKMEICGDFIIGLPGDTLEDVHETIALSQGLDIQYASFNVATPLPGSSLRSAAVASGKMRPEDRHFDSLGKNRVLGSDHLDSATILRLRNRAVREFYLRPGYLARRLSSLSGWEHFAIQIQEAIHLVRKSC